MSYEWKPYVPAAKRRQRAARKIAKLRKSGQEVSPVEIVGIKIAKTFWGESWCRNLEEYSDYANRLPRGRAYARNGSIIDLRIEAGRVRALVSGSSFYDVDIAIRPLTKKRWNAIKTQSAGKIDSMVELLRGSISKGVMRIVTRHGEGLFPSPKEISLDCSCPDWATMCKHVAAALYGVGARLDHEPEMLFTLRGVDPTEMVAAVTDVPAIRKQARGRVLKTDDLSSIFGIDLDVSVDSYAKQPPQPARRTREKVAVRAPKKTATKRKKPAAKKAASKNTASKNTKAATATSKRTAAKKVASKRSRKLP